VSIQSGSYPRAERSSKIFWKGSDFSPRSTIWVEQLTSLGVWVGGSGPDPSGSLLSGGRLSGGRLSGGRLSGGRLSGGRLSGFRLSGGFT
jgi:uncharacterized protein YjbI with pentapeptide repeats